MLELTIEQKFALAAFNAQVDKMNHEQAKQMLKVVNEAYAVQKSAYLSLLKEAWKLEPNQ